MFNRFFNSQTKTITSAAFILGISALTSRILGLIRDRLLAGNFGAGEELDIYFAAFRIPDFVYGILIMGGITAVFLPVFAEYFKKGEKEAWEFTSNLLNFFLVLLIIICGILAIFTPLIINLVVPGFSSASKEMAITLTRIMFLSPILFGMSSIFSGILHYFNRFLAYSLAPILYNLGIIFGILFLVPIFGLSGLAYGVILGAVLHWLFQIPAALNSGFKYFPILRFKDSGIGKVFKLMIPRIIGAAAYHLNLIVITAIASTLTAGSIAVFNFANNLQYIPVGLVGTSFALAVFPVLSRNWANGEKKEFAKNFSLTFRRILFLTIPFSILMFVFRNEIVQLILKTGQFGIPDVKLTAEALGFFTPGIFALSAIPFLARVFYSFQDTKTPVIIGVSSMIINIILAFILSNRLGLLGLPLAVSLAAIFQFSLLLIFLQKKFKILEI